MMDGCESKESVRTSLKQLFWILSKTMRPNLANDIDVKFQYNADDLQEWPPTIPNDIVWVIDRCVSASDLGPGTMIYKSYFARTYKVPSDNLALEDVEDEGDRNSADKSVSSSMPEPADSAELPSEAPPRKLRRLFSQVSDNIAEECDTFDNIALQTKLAAEKGALYNKDN